MNSKLAEKIKHTYKKPYGAIQWKGTDVCIDIYCDCGNHSHYDGYFMYYIKCPACGKTYLVNNNIQLLPIDNKDESLGNLVQIPQE